LPNYIALLILKRIFRIIQSEDDLSEESKLYHIFNFIVGISTGGLIAIGKFYMTIDKYIREYEIVDIKIFEKKLLGK
jgi:patatin-like phospholipase/acyl hydrolase